MSNKVSSKGLKGIVPLIGARILQMDDSSKSISERSMYVNELTTSQTRIAGFLDLYPSLLETIKVSLPCLNKNLESKGEEEVLHLYTTCVALATSLNVEAGQSPSLGIVMFADIVNLLAEIIEECPKLVPGPEGSTDQLRDCLIILLLQCFPDPKLVIDKSDILEDIVTILMAFLHSTPNIPSSALHQYVAKQVEKLADLDFRLFGNHMSAILIAINDQGHSEYISYFIKNSSLFKKNNSELVEGNLTHMINAFGFKRVQYVCVEISRRDARLLVPHIGILLVEMESGTLLQRRIILDIMCRIALEEPLPVYAAIQPLVTNAERTPSLIIPLLKVLALVSAISNEAAMQVLFHLAKLVRSGLALNKAQQASVLVAFNIAKDTCTYCNLFQATTLDALKELAPSNEAAYKNLMSWNSGKGGYGGDVLLFLQTEQPYVPPRRSDAQRRKSLDFVAARKSYAQTHEGSSYTTTGATAGTTAGGGSKKEIVHGLSGKVGQNTGGYAANLRANEHVHQQLKTARTDDRSGSASEEKSWLQAHVQSGLSDFARDFTIENSAPGAIGCPLGDVSGNSWIQRSPSEEGIRAQNDQRENVTKGVTKRWGSPRAEGVSNKHPELFEMVPTVSAKARSLLLGTPYSSSGSAASASSSSRDDRTAAERMLNSSGDIHATQSIRSADVVKEYTGASLSSKLNSKSSKNTGRVLERKQSLSNSMRLSKRGDMGGFGSFDSEDEGLRTADITTPAASISARNRKVISSSMRTAALHAGSSTPGSSKREMQLLTELVSLKAQLAQSLKFRNNAVSPAPILADVDTPAVAASFREKKPLYAVGSRVEVKPKLPFLDDDDDDDGEEGDNDVDSSNNNNNNNKIPWERGTITEVYPANAAATGPSDLLLTVQYDEGGVDRDVTTDTIQLEHRVHELDEDGLPAGGGFFVGVRVLSRWRGQYDLFPGTITSVKPRGTTYDVMYDSNNAITTAVTALSSSKLSNRPSSSVKKKNSSSSGKPVKRVEAGVVESRLRPVSSTLSSSSSSSPFTAPIVPNTVTKQLFATDAASVDEATHQTQVASTFGDIASQAAQREANATKLTKWQHTSHAHALEHKHEEGMSNYEEQLEVERLTEKKKLEDRLLKKKMRREHLMREHGLTLEEAIAVEEQHKAEEALATSRRAAHSIEQQVHLAAAEHSGGNIADQVVEEATITGTVRSAHAATDVADRRELRTQDVETAAATITTTTNTTTAHAIEMAHKEGAAQVQAELTKAQMLNKKRLDERLATKQHSQQQTSASPALLLSSSSAPSDVISKEEAIEGALVMARVPPQAGESVVVVAAAGGGGAGGAGLLWALGTISRDRGHDRFDIDFENRALGHIIDCPRSQLRKPPSSSSSSSSSSSFALSPPTLESDAKNGTCISSTTAAVAAAEVSPPRGSTAALTTGRNDSKNNSNTNSRTASRKNSRVQPSADDYRDSSSAVVSTGSSGEFKGEMKSQRK